MELRWYQKAAIESVYKFLGRKLTNPVVELPTGSGKTPVSATLCRDVVESGGRVLVLAHRKELLEQTADKLRIIAPEVDCGIYSAGLKRRDTKNPCIVAGIHSVHNKADKLGAFDLIIVDECHLIPFDDDGMYRTFLGDSQVIHPSLRIVGLTATPYRLKGGTICRRDHFLNEICYSADIKTLIEQGYLCRLVTKSGNANTSTDGLKIRGGEFIAKDAELLMGDAAIVRAAVAEIVELTQNRSAVLIFASGVDHALNIAAELTDRHGQDCGAIFGDTDPSERASYLRQFREGNLRYLVNVDVLTTGFDATNIDCVALLRPTMSPGLYSQMVGRGLRIDPFKDDCLILDFADNIKRHGAIDKIEEPKETQSSGSEGEVDQLVRVCPKCELDVKIQFRFCPGCGYQFPRDNVAKHDTHASSDAIISEPVEPEDLEVTDIKYFLHRKKGEPYAKPTMRVEYSIGPMREVREWVCFEHEGFARNKAVSWWKQRSPDPPPETVERALELAEAGALRWTERIKVKPDGKYERIVGYEFGEMPEAVTFLGQFEIKDDWADDVPF